MGSEGLTFSYNTYHSGGLTQIAIFSDFYFLIQELKILLGF